MDTLEISKDLNFKPWELIHPKLDQIVAEARAAADTEIAKLRDALGDLVFVLEKFEETQDEDSYSDCYYKAKMNGDSFWIPINAARAILADEPKENKCPTCKGTGRILESDRDYTKGDKCPRCSGGTAPIFIDEPKEEQDGR